MTELAAAAATLYACSDARLIASDESLLDCCRQLAEAADAEDEATRSAGIRALFAGLIEPWGDGFDAEDRAAYQQCFATIIAVCAERRPALAQALATFGLETADDILIRARRRAPLPTAAKRIVVLSRVTVGADILLTSVLLQHLRARWPAAEIHLAGDAKLAGLFGGMPGLRLAPISYPRRGPLGERLLAWTQLVAITRELDCDLVCSADSRLNQLGLLPLLPERSREWHWATLQPDSAEPQPLAELLDRSCAEVFGSPSGQRPRLAFDAATMATAERLRAAFGPRPLACVKLDHGGNPAKALPQAFAVALLQRLRQLGWRILLDRGFGRDELADSDRLLAAAGLKPLDLDDSGQGLGQAIETLTPGSLADTELLRFHGSIAGWAACVSTAALAISYDSVGHHLAAALGTPLLSVFTGHPHPGFPIAWQPCGRGPITQVTIPSGSGEDPASWQAVWTALSPPPPVS